MYNKLHDIYFASQLYFKRAQFENKMFIFIFLFIVVVIVIAIVIVIVIAIVIVSVIVIINIIAYANQSLVKRLLQSILRTLQ